MISPDVWMLAYIVAAIATMLGVVAFSSFIPERIRHRIEFGAGSVIFLAETLWSLWRGLQAVQRADWMAAASYAAGAGLFAYLVWCVVRTGRLRGRPSGGGS